MNDSVRFNNRMEFRKWLKLHAEKSSGIWLVFSKCKDIPSITANEALEEALCVGWIDGKIKKVDDFIYQKYFSPRRENSNWSEKNKRLVAELISKKLMTPMGYKAIETAKKCGKWEKQKTSINFDEVLLEFASVLKNEKELLKRYNDCSDSYKKQLAMFYFEAKQEKTKQKRLEKIRVVLKEGKKGILY